MPDGKGKRDLSLYDLGYNAGYGKALTVNQEQIAFRNMNNFELKLEIEDILLQFAGLYNEVTTSDLQGIATAKADEIIKLVRG